jgi:DNA end-binding protein Ku
VTALRSLWNGTLRLEALQVPVALAATRAGGDVSLRTLHRPCAHPMVQGLECPAHGQVPSDELVSGWEVTPGEFVLIEKDELDQLATSPDRTIDVLQVFPVDDLDRTLVQASYWLMPAAGDFSRRGYSIITIGLGAKHALLVRLAYRSEKIAAVTVERGALLLQVLAAADERVSPAPIVDDVATVEVSNREATLARKLMRGKLQPLNERLIVNPRRRALRALLERKLGAGAETVAPDPAIVSVAGAGGAGPVDLEDQLRRSLEQLQGAAA